MLKPARTCMFCGGLPLSTEHAIPQWIGEVLHSMEPKGATWETRFRFGTPYEIAERQHPAPGNRPVIEINCVCRSCNTTWMASLEGRVRPVLEPIIRGIDSRLDQSAQLLIATWSVKTSMVLERMRRVHRVYTDDDCRVLFAKQHPPATYRVRLAAIDDPTSNPLRVQTFVASTGSTDKSPADVICTTMFIGHAVVQVWGGSGAGEVDLTTPGTAVSDAVMVWPPVAGHAPWPPRVRLLEHQVEQFCRQPIPGADVDGFLDGW